MTRDLSRETASSVSSSDDEEDKRNLIPQNETNHLSNSLLILRIRHRCNIGLFLTTPILHIRPQKSGEEKKVSFLVIVTITGRSSLFLCGSGEFVPQVEGMGFEVCGFFLL